MVLRAIRRVEMNRRGNTISRKRACPGCHFVVPDGEAAEAYFTRTAAGYFLSRCKRCACEYAREYQKRPDKKEAIAARKSDYYQSNRDARFDGRGHSLTNRYKRVRSAVEWGKTSPITGRTGFALALDIPSGLLRAARLDTPLGPSEVGLVRYERINGAWHLSLPPVINPAFRADARWVLRLCEKREKKAAEGVKK
jgi:hypothetical protein